MHHLLNEIAVTVIAATISGLLCHFMKQPIILGYVIAGLAIGGNFGLGLVEDPHTIEIISELGLVLLLYIIGLEINLRQLLSSGKQLLLTAIGQYPLCVGLALLFFSVFSLPYVSTSLEHLYLALLCGLSSTAIVVKGLYDKGEIDTLPGRMTIGTLVFQDMYAILVLAVQPNLASPSVLPIALALGSTFVLLGFGYFMSKYVLSALFKAIAKSPEMVVCVSLGWCAVMAGAAYQLNVSIEMGALLAGLAISAFPYSIHITAKTLPLRDFFLTLFFVSLGMKLTIPNGPIIGPMILIGIFILLSRFLTIYPLLSLTGAGRRAAFITSLNLSQLSEFALVISSIGLTLGHLNKDFVSLLVITMVVLSLISSYAIRFSHELFLLSNKLLSKVKPEKETRNDSDLDAKEYEIVFLGFHRGGKALLSAIEKNFPDLLEKVLVIDFNPLTLAELRTKGVAVLFADISSYDTLEHAHISHSKIILSTIPDMLLKGTNNRNLIRMIRGIAPNASIVASADDLNHEQTLREEGADNVLLPHEITGQWLAPLIDNAIKNKLGARSVLQNANWETMDICT